MDGVAQTRITFHSLVEVDIESLSSTELYKEGTKFLKAGDFKSAVNYLAASVRKEPNAYQSNFNLAAAYQKWGRIDDALRVIESLMSIYPSVPSGWSMMGSKDKLE